MRTTPILDTATLDKHQQFEALWHYLVSLSQK